MTSTLPTDYLALIAATLRAGLLARGVEEADRPDAIAVACALPAMATRLGMSVSDAAKRASDRELSGKPTGATFVDGFGHARPAYRAIALRAIARSSPGVARPWIERFAHDVREPLERFAAGAGDLAGSRGGAVVGIAAAAWLICSVYADAIDAALRHAGKIALLRLARFQQPNGTFLARASADNPEPLWYDELALLHFLSTRADEDTEIADAVGRSVAYHAAEVQPDHASSHPWAIAAFLARPDGVQLADMMLHAAGVQQPSTMDAVSLLLLGDAMAESRSRD